MVSGRHILFLAEFFTRLFPASFFFFMDHIFGDSDDISFGSTGTG
jgi:hypothetical protein